MGSFKEIGGKVEVNGACPLKVSFELDQGGMAIGDIDSAELKGSAAPLLLPIYDQRKLVLGFGPRVYARLHLQEDVASQLEGGVAQWTSGCTSPSSTLGHDESS